MVALITGGSSGMGLEFARQLAARGYGLVLVSNQEQALAEAARELSGPVTVRTRCQDLAHERGADELFAWCRAEGILPDVLVNDAGMFFFKELQTEDRTASAPSCPPCSLPARRPGWWTSMP
ncbi:MAG: SDR family NAD(P)-dependent oxidoreductase [Bacteroidales bacterium]|nr:SDR family NAD(P)-dependent oxidoreductase [Bacteroidales bacterium]